MINPLLITKLIKKNLDGVLTIFKLNKLGNWYIFSLNLMEDNSNKIDEIKDSLEEIKDNQNRIERHFGNMLIVIFCLLIFIFIGLISIIEITRYDVFENLKLLFFITVIVLVIFGLYKYYQVANKEAKLHINRIKDEGVALSSIKNFFTYVEQYFSFTVLLFVVLVPSIVIYLVLGLLGF